MTTSIIPTAVVLSEPWHRDGGGPWGLIFPLAWLLVIAALVTAAVILFRRNRQHGPLYAGEARLSERFAAGEVDEQEYRERLAVLRERGR